ncbi:MAG: di-trans,poly-cis-decaprenylcistransferase [Clostridia bacterium]|nr:di-trans,poly-cis-decaprenylcistransferase [Clostridia bacterium]
MTNNDSVKKVDERLRHIAFIMDGNGRWATARNMPREYGHKNGARVFREITEYCHKIGIKYLTVYAFSTENWKRPKREVNAIMKLLDEYLDKQRPDNASIRFIGDVSILDPKIVEKIDKMTKETAGHEYVLNVAINYGSRAELVTAFNKLLADGKSEVTEQDVNAALYTGDCPDPDLIVRTGGDLRISNFLLWQAAYSELYFTDTLWPDMTSEDVDRAVDAFYSRKRRFGGLDKEPEKKD